MHNDLFSNMVINEWNNLPKNVINSHDLDELKKEYNKWTIENYSQVDIKTFRAL